MTDDNDKAKTFFILHDADVVEKKVADVVSKMFNDSIDKPTSRNNAMNLLYVIMTADASNNHPVMNGVMDELFHSRRLRMDKPNGDFIDSLRTLIQGIVQEQITRAMHDIDRRVVDLKRAEYSSRYKW